ncbi:hypothetical protein ACIBCN_43880 [Nocardia sp. NPDC051052]|uniref:hypothetical protein n=1 Tax=Nocardia sp. NPDC051052 TaxID=3364322 RepID=UPI0037B89BE3
MATAGVEQVVGADYPLAIAVALIMTSVIVVTLVTVQICTWLWRLAALSDPLTTLLNRRGFDYYLLRSVSTSPSDRLYVISTTHPGGYRRRTPTDVSRGACRSPRVANRMVRAKVALA